MSIKTKIRLAAGPVARTLLVAVAVAAMWATPAWAATINVPVDFPTIQQAINAAAPGDFVQVGPGFYPESLTVNKTLTLAGAGAGITIIDALGAGSVMSLTASDVRVRDFTLRGGLPGGRGVHFVGADRSTIERCDISNNRDGLYFSGGATNNVILACTIHSNTGYGIDVGDQGNSGNQVLDSEIYGNGLNGVNAYAGSNGLQVRGSNVHHNAGAGVLIGWSTSWAIDSSDIHDNLTGIMLDTASQGAITGSDVLTNTASGMYFSGLGTYWNTVTGNTIRGSTIGVELASMARYNQFERNRITDNVTGAKVGFQSNPSYDNFGNTFFHNNFVDNGVQAQDLSTGGNNWNRPLPDGGNYWSDWTAPDVDWDGFVDLPYAFTTGRDNLPFTYLDGWDRVATTLSLVGDQTVSNLGATAKLTGTLLANQAPLAGRSDVEVWRSMDGQNWSSDGTAAWNVASQTYDATRPLPSARYFEMRFPGDASYGASDSNEVYLKPQVYLTRPTVKVTRTITRRGRLRRIKATGPLPLTYIMSGSLKPPHQGNTEIEIAYQSGEGYQLYSSIPTTNTNVSAYLAKYTASTQLGYGVRWRVRAHFTGDGDHEETWSAPTYFFIPARLGVLLGAIR